jgi:hypothetical protein
MIRNVLSIPRSRSGMERVGTKEQNNGPKENKRYKCHSVHDAERD